MTGNAILRGVVIPFGTLLLGFFVFFVAGMLRGLGPLDAQTATWVFGGLWVGAPVVGGLLSSELGVSQSALTGVWPLHGLRHRPDVDTNGWYVSSGEYSDSPDFFLPLHVEHAAERIPAVLAYLSLPLASGS
jgi:hypothetical protein